jgi:hypothetical protein
LIEVTNVGLKFEAAISAAPLSVVELFPDLIMEHYVKCPALQLWRDAGQLLRLLFLHALYGAGGSVEAWKDYYVAVT